MEKSVEYLLIATKYDGTFIGPIAKLLGYIIDFIYSGLAAIGIENVGIAIIVFTLLVKLLMLPLTIKQQKFSKMSAIMNPEIQEIQKKYDGKKDDQAAMMKMQDETKAVYEKYGVSPSGSCLQLLIQMPILFALYRVIMLIPAYVSQINAYYAEIVTVAANNGVISKIDEIYSAETVYLEDFASVTDAATLTTDNINTVIDYMSTFTSSQWDQVKALFTGADLSTVTEAVEKINHAYTFCGINLAQTPASAMGLSLLIPVLAGVTQWLSAKIGNDANQMNQSNQQGGGMKMMTYMMPLISVFFCFSLQAGIGLYWVIGAVYQIIFQLAVNAYYKKADMNKIIEKNVEKANKKRAKKGKPPQKIASNANMNSKYNTNSPSRSGQSSTGSKNNSAKNTSSGSGSAKKDSTDSTSGSGTSGKGGGSIASKANMVQDYNERHKKK